jgi:hypothetical protein
MDVSTETPVSTGKKSKWAPNFVPIAEDNIESFISIFLVHLCGMLLRHGGNNFIANIRW